MKLKICNLKHRAFKIALFGFFITIFILATSFALGADKSQQAFSPLELSYPNIPGLGRFSDYQNLDPSLQIGFIVNYIFKLVFFISIGAGLIALLVSGVLYIVSLSKPKWIILSRQMASNAMLGLFILLCAYLFLYFINPQLLSLTLEKPKLEQITSTTANQYDPNTVVVQKVSFAEDLNSSLDNLEEEIHIDKNGQYYETVNGKDCITDGYGGTINKGGIYLRDITDEKNQDKKNGCVAPTKNIVAVSTIQNNRGFWGRAFAFLLTGANAAPTQVQDEVIYRAEIPLRETADALKIVAPLVSDLQKLLAKCQCGTSLGYPDWSMGNPGCKPGLESKIGEYQKNIIYGLSCLNQSDDCGTAKDYNGCLLCDLHDVRQTKSGAIQVCTRYGGICKPDKLIGDTIKSDSCWSLITDANIDGLLPITRNKDNCQTNNGAVPSGVLVPTKIKVSNLIKFKILKIQEQQAKMQARAKIDARFLDSATLIARASNANGIEFSTSQATGYWGFDFANKAKEIQSAGYNLVIQDANNAGGANSPAVSGGSSGAGFNAPKSNGFLARIKSFFSPFITGFAMAQNQYVSEHAATFYYITHAPAGAQPQDISDKNSAIARDARRYNLFSLLTDLPLEGIEQIFRDCLTSAFGQANYKLDQGQIEDVVKAVMDSGAADHLKAVIQNMVDKIAQAAVDGAKQAISNDVNTRLVGQFLAKCQGVKGCSGKTSQDIANDIASGNCQILTNSCCYCVKNLMSNGVPPNYLSKTFSNLFDVSLANELPNINIILNTKVADLFPPDQKIGKFLNTPMLNVYDTIFKGALTTPFQDQIPGLNTLLDKQMKDVLPDFIVNQITNLNTWFEKTVSSTKSCAKSASNKMADALVKEYVSDPMHEWAQNQFDKLGIGTEHLTISACFENLEKGYVYKDNNGKYAKGEANFVRKTEADSGTCVKITPEEINQFGLNTTVPKSFDFGTDSSDTATIQGVNYFSLPVSMARTICENSGFAWEGGDGGSGCWKKDDLAKDIKAAKDTVSDLDKTKTYIAGGMVNYAEKMATAFTETALQFALAYARVFVEDNFINPLMAYWNSISGFQQGMSDFLTTSVRGILPAQISGFLQSNIATQLDSFCKQYYTPSKKALQNDSNPSNDNDNVVFNFKVSLPEGILWKDDNGVSQTYVSQEIDISQETGDAMCKIDKALNTTPWQEITIMCERNKNTDPKDREAIETNLCKGVDTLNEKLIKVLSEICISENECFDIESWFNRPLLSIFLPNAPLEVIKKLVGPEGTPKNLICGNLPVLKQNNHFINPVVLCKDIISNQFGVIPVFKKDSELTQEQIDLKPWCAFVYAACSPNVVPGQTTLGKLVKNTITSSCVAYDNQANCSSQCYCKWYCPKITNSSCFADKNVCQTCSSLSKNSIFYSLISLAVQNEPKNGDRKNETQFYSDMLNEFPSSQADIKGAATQRGISWADVLATNAKANFGFSDLVGFLEKTSSIQEPTLRNILKQDEILGLTPYEVLTTQVCPKFKEGTDERAFCDALNQTPQKAAGLDKPLKEYIRPEEFQILFDMLQNDLKDGSPSDCQKGEQFIERSNQGLCCDDNLDLCYKVGEKPAALSQLLDFMERKDPVEALRGLQQTMPENDQGFSGVFPFITMISDLKNYPNCLSPGKTIQSQCSPVSIADLEANGLPPNATVLPADQDINIIFEDEIHIAKESVLGMAVGGGTVAVRYYFVKPLGEENLILAYREPNPAKVAFRDTLDFMITPIGDIVNKMFGNQTIADYICNQVFPADPENPTAITLCDAKIDVAWRNNSAKVMGILQSTPLDLVEKYLNKPLVIKPGQSLMDMISANTALGQPIVDTLGALTGLDAFIKDSIGDPFAKKIAWVDAGAKSGVKAIQNGLQTALVDWLKEIAPELLAEFYGFNVGKNTANDVAGSCRSVAKGAVCNKEGEVPKNIDTDNAQCCILAKGESCQPRCREVDDKVLQCDVLSGERPQVEKQMIDGKVHFVCCFAGVEDNVNGGAHPVGFQTTEPTAFRNKPAEGCDINEVEEDGKCYSSTIQFCKKSRAVDFSAGGKCRTTNESGNLYETPEGSGANGTCFFYETYRRTLPANPGNKTPTIEDQGYCCSTVSQCIANRFSSHLENIADMMADGNIPIDSLKK